MLRTFFRKITLNAALAAALLVAVDGCVPLPPADDTLAELAVQQGMEAVISHLDSPAWAARVSWPEHIVQVYRLALDRDPTPVEYAMVQTLREHPGLRRSDVLALALATNEDVLTWETCAGFLSRNKSLPVEPDATVTATARRLFGTPPERIAALLQEDAVEDTDDGAPVPEDKGTETPDETYGFYFGFLHAHSHLSFDADPEGSPLEAYTTARDQGGLDFFSLTDHAEFLIIWPWEHKWQKLRDAADATDEPGVFAAMWGFEWSNPFLGHVSVLNTEDFTHTFKTFRMRGLYNWIADRPSAFAQFNHPGDYDYLGVEFLRFSPHPRAAAQMVGIETWNESRTLDQYFYAGSWDSDLSFLDVANQKGWRIGALGAQDNHSRDWGFENDFRTGILATELTREGVAEAFRSRRFYATEDKDLELDLRCAGYPMGSILTGTQPVFTVSANDRSNDSFEQVRLYRNGVQVAAQAVSGNPVSVTLSVPPSGGAGDYFYVIVTQADDNDANGRNDEALSSPIWIDN
jgi:hypothetical protein